MADDGGWQIPKGKGAGRAKTQAAGKTDASTAKTYASAAKPTVSEAKPAASAAGVAPTCAPGAMPPIPESVVDACNDELNKTPDLARLVFPSRMPFLYCKHLFEMTANPDQLSRQLAAASRLLIAATGSGDRTVRVREFVGLLDFDPRQPVATAIPSAYFNAFALELRPATLLSEFGCGELKENDAKKWVLGVRIDTAKWFNSFLSLLPGVSAVDVARAYVNRISVLPRPMPRGPTHETCVEVKEHCVYRPCTIPPNHPRHASHPKLQCMGVLKRKGTASTRPCWQFAHDDLVIPALMLNAPSASGSAAVVVGPVRAPAPADMVVQARKEASREMLLWPRLHTTNALWVADPVFWRSVLHVSNGLSKLLNLPVTELVAGVTLNYGPWETRIASETGQSQYADTTLECHAHAHLLLTSKAADVYDVDGSVLPVMRGRTGDPMDYVRMDAHALEVNAVMPAELHEMHKNMATLKTEVSDLKTEVSHVKTEVHHLDNKVNDMNQSMHKKFHELGSAVTNLTAKFEEMISLLSAPKATAAATASGSAAAK